MDYDFTSSTAAEDLKGILDFLNINQTYLVAHDKGCGQSAALAAKYPSIVKRAVFAEYPLPAFGYENTQPYELNNTLYQNWQLAFFSVPDAAQYFIQGREKEMLAWYFFHSAYAGNAVISDDDLDYLTREISKPGFLRSGLEYFATTYADAMFFNSTIRNHPLEMPMLVLGGEASFAPVSLLRGTWGPVGTDVSYDVVPKAGHWIGESLLSCVCVYCLRDGSDVKCGPQRMRIQIGLRLGLRRSSAKMVEPRLLTCRISITRSLWLVISFN